VERFYPLTDASLPRPRDRSFFQPGPSFSSCHGSFQKRRKKAEQAAQVCVGRFNINEKPEADYSSSDVTTGKTVSEAKENRPDRPRRSDRGSGRSGKTGSPASARRHRADPDKMRRARGGGVKGGVGFLFRRSSASLQRFGARLLDWGRALRAVFFCYIFLPRHPYHFGCPQQGGPGSWPLSIPGHIRIQVQIVQPFPPSSCKTLRTGRPGTRAVR